MEMMIAEKVVLTGQAFVYGKVQPMTRRAFVVAGCFVIASAFNVACSSNIQSPSSQVPSKEVLGPETLSGQAREAMRTITDHIGSFVLTITLSPVVSGQTDSNPGLRSLMLYTSFTMLIEPHAEWPDGQPISADARITEDEAVAIITVLADGGFFDSAEKYYSERSPIDSAFPPPTDARDYRDRRFRNDQHYSIRVTVHDDHWYTYYEALLPWNTQMIGSLDAIGKVLSGAAAEKMAQLIGAARVEH